jgi:DNA-binding MarR family transcriptional regulator
VSPEEELRFLILGAQREGNRLLADQFAPLGLTPSQAEVLRRLAEAEPLSLIALGGLLVCETGSPSRLVNTLVKKKLVERAENAGDRRQVSLRLTPEGRLMATRVAQVEDRLHGWMRERLGADALAATAARIRRLLKGTSANDAIERRKASATQRTRRSETIPGG